MTRSGRARGSQTAEGDSWPAHGKRARVDAGDGKPVAARVIIEP